MISSQGLPWAYQLSPLSSLCVRSCVGALVWIETGSGQPWLRIRTTWP